VAAYTAGCPAVSGPSGGGGSVGSWKRGPATSPEPALLEPSTVSQRRRPPPLDEPEPPAERGVLCPSLSSGDMGESGGRPSSDDVWIEGAGVVVRCLSVKTSLGPSSSLSVRPSGVPGRLGAGLSPATLPVGERGFGDGGRVCGDVTNLQKLAMAGKQMRRMINHQRLSGALQEMRTHIDRRTWPASSSNRAGERGRPLQCNSAHQVSGNQEQGQMHSD
jgi:hypothetical protein